jgi:hypothetical protein
MKNQAREQQEESSKLCSETLIEFQRTTRLYIPEDRSRLFKDLPPQTD